MKTVDYPQLFSAVIFLLAAVYVMPKAAAADVRKSKIMSEIKPMLSAAEALGQLLAANASASLRAAKH